MKRSKKMGLVFGIFLMVFFITYRFLQTDDFSVKNIVKLFAIGILSGGIGGWLFGWINSKFSGKPK